MVARKTGGDDLDDGLELDPDLIASDGEEYDEADGSEAGFLSEEEDDDEAPVSRKRKADDDGEGNGADMTPEELAAERRKRRRQKDKARKAAKRAAAEGDDVEMTHPTHLSQSELANMFLNSVRATMPNSSVMEIEDVTIPENRILAPPTTAPEEGEFGPLVARLEELLKTAPKAPKAGTPRVIIISLSGIRCADVVRAVRGVKRPGGDVAKLFAKHFKLVDQIKYLNKSRVAIAVGTPARVSQLLAEGALKITPQTTVLLDIGHHDSKKRSLLSLPEVRGELWKSLFSGASRRALFDGRAHFAAF